MSEARKFSALGWVVWILCALFFTYEFLLRTVLGTFERPIVGDLNLNLITFAILSSTAYQVVYGLMQIPVGMITGRYGLKLTLLIAVSVCAFAVFGFGLTAGFGTAFVFRLLMGFGSSFGFVCLLLAVYEWMPRNRTALFIGLSQFIGTLGPMIAAGPLNSMATTGDTNWRHVFTGLAVVGVALLLPIALVVRNNTASVGSFRVLKLPGSPLRALAELLREPQVWFIALFSGAVYFCIEYLSENSGTKYMVLHGFQPQTASYMVTLAWLGYGLGAPVLGFLSDLLSSRKKLMLAASLIAVSAATVIFYFPVNKAVAMTAWCFLGVGTSGNTIAFAAVAERSSAKGLALGLAFNNGVNMLIASAVAPVAGAILGAVSAGATAPSVGHYQTTFGYILAFMSVSALTAIFLIKETHCRSKKEVTFLSVARAGVRAANGRS